MRDPKSEIRDQGPTEVRDLRSEARGQGLKVGDSQSKFSKVLTFEIVEHKEKGGGRSDRRMAVLGMPLVPLVTEGVQKAF